MFIPCPHCGFLVALILPAQSAAPGEPARRCPRCDGELRDHVPETSEAIDSGDARGSVAASPAVGSASPGAGSEPTRLPSAADRDTSVTGRRADTTDATDAFDASDASASTPATSVGSVDADASDLSDAPDPAIGTNVNTGDRDARTATADLPAPPATTPASPTARTRRTPSFVRGNTPATRSRLAWPWHAAIVLLGLVLALQLLLAQRHELAASAHWRPWVSGLCNALPCSVPPWREPQAFTMLERSVRPDAAMPEVLAVQASFRNDARWPQPWPTLLLGLSDVEGRQVGLRAFAPAEYREAGAAGDDLLAPGQSATVHLQVREPAPRIVAFTFDFQ